MKEWAALNQCSTTTTQIYSKGRAYCDVYQNCAEGADVEFCTVRAMGHTWPTWENTRNAIDATDFFWDFFEAHPFVR
jgi:poly(3-hydroxybutyrate) depolymerase